MDFLKKYLQFSPAFDTSLKKGFTLVELLVTITIFAVVTALVLFKHDKFNGGILLTNLAYDVALTIREAQIFGLNVREVEGSSTGFQYAYGVQFRTGQTYDQQFILYADTNGSRTYTSNDTIINKYNIKKGNYISEICIMYATSCPKVSVLDITYLRPKPEATIRWYAPGGQIGGTYNAKITIAAPDGSTRDIIVRRTGQISIE